MYKETLIKATEAGAAELKRFFNGTYSISNKEGLNNLVTDADHAADKAIINVLKKEFPSHGIVSEESKEIVSESEYKWIIDPIDGTVNFANNIPICCVSIGLEHKGKMLMGAVFNPIMNEFFFAERGKGATLNGVAIHVSTKSEVLTSCLVTGFPYTYLEVIFGLKNYSDQSELLNGVMDLLADIRKEARSKKDFATSDKIRNQLSELGILMKDEKDGSISWTNK